jgi:tetratricopeptide (TPR) repeat protein
LAAAAFISFISLGIIWWNSQNRKQETEIAANRQKENASKSNEPLPSPENGKNNNIPDASTAKDNTTANSNLEKTTIEKANRDQLFTAYFTPDNSPESIEGPLEDALRYFKGKRYEEAIRAFNIVDFGPLSRGDEEESQQLLKFYASYYKGLSYLASDSGNANAAIKELKKAVSISPDKNWQRKAEWYLALAHIKNGNLAEAESLMKDVAGNNHSGKYKKQAIQLLDELHGNQHKN